MDKNTDNSNKQSKTNMKKKKKIKVYRDRKRNTESETDIIQKLQEKYKTIDTSSVKTFLDFPLSNKTLRGLKDNDYMSPTEIQRDSIGPALNGHDILGAANTGSGKTLAFLIPILEKLYTLQWTRLDGLGALIITPTRELAYQIFETLKKIGAHHDFSAGLIIGGKDLHFEKKRMDQCNIVICTPGRILQHMDENPLFDAINMKILVLDEADRCLDLGFAQTMNGIIANLPDERQTLLFSATQTKSVKDLARLSLKNPVYVSVHEHAKFSTPEGLQQSYIVCELYEKVSVLWSFIRNHAKQKVIVFLSSCKQVKYVYEVFCKLRPGVSLLALYGSLHQMKRMAIYDSFCRKGKAVLFATDIAARGLDFPEVHWVVQADCPEDANTYIHRAGRTARYQKGGESLLILLPSEEKAMIEQLEEKKIPINQIKINPSKLQNPQRKIEAFLAKNPQLKDTAQRAFVAYAKSVFLMKNKQVFDVQKLDTDSFATSLGLAIPPRIRFLQRLNKKRENNNKEFNLEIKSSDDESNEDEIQGEEIPKFDFSINENSGDEDMLKMKRINHDIEIDSEENDLEIKTKNKKALTKAAIAKRILKKKIVPNTKKLFDEEGEIILNETKDKRSEMAKDYENEDEGGINIEQAKLVLKEEDKFDKQRFREKIKQKHKTEKKKLKEMKQGEVEGEKDDFGSEDSDSGPDLSWLPDPDKVYGKGGGGSEENSGESGEEDSSSGEDAPEVHRPTKRKLVTKKDIAKNTSPEKKKKKISDLSNVLSVNEAEELALQLLRGNI